MAGALAKPCMGWTRNASGARAQRGSIMLLVIFIMAMTTPLFCLMLETHTNAIRGTHNWIEGSTALYVAEAGVHDAIGELLLDPTWRDGFTDKAFPTDLRHTYTVTAVDGSQGEIILTSTGRTTSGYAKTITVTLTGF